MEERRSIADNIARTNLERDRVAAAMWEGHGHGDTDLEDIEWAAMKTTDLRTDARDKNSTQGASEPKTNLCTPEGLVEGPPKHGSERPTIRVKKAGRFDRFRQYSECAHGCHQRGSAGKSGKSSELGQLGGPDGTCSRANVNVKIT